MVKAYRMQEKTKQVGFEWSDKEDVWRKLEEELSELKEVLDDASMEADRKEDEFGDVLFSLINFGRYYGLDAETSLAKVNKKFISRFKYIESKATKPLNEMTLNEMDSLWDEAKLRENTG
jgi:XTP/dITP diphosphohydrolase